MELLFNGETKTQDLRNSRAGAFSLKYGKNGWRRKEEEERKREGK